jgi:hypothetical protein
MWNKMKKDYVSSPSNFTKTKFNFNQEKENTKKIYRENMVKSLRIYSPMSHHSTSSS